MAMAMRSMVAARLSLSGPRMAFWTKFGPPWPWVLTRRLLASSIWVSSRSRLRLISAIAESGTSGSLLATSGQVITGVVAAWAAWSRSPSGDWAGGFFSSSPVSMRTTGQK